MPNKDKKIKFPEANRPLVCPPDRAAAELPVLLLGFLLRAAILFGAVFGLVLFLTTAFRIELPAKGPALAAAASVLLFGAMTLSRLAALSLGSLTALGLGALAVFAPSFFTGIPAFLCTYINKGFDYLASVGFFTFGNQKLPTLPTVYSEEESLLFAAVILAVFLGAIFSLCLMRRMILLPPALLSSLILFFVFTHNISCSNLAVALILSSFAALLVLYAYDKRYLRAPRTETALLFGEEEDVPAPDRRRERAEKRRALRAKKREQGAITVDDELSLYFSGSRKADKKKPKLTPAERLEKRRARRTASARAWHNSAAGGLAAGATFLVCLLLLALPATYTKNNFREIGVIEKPMSYCRDFVTALLQGDDPMLDLLAFEREAGAHASRSTAATPPNYIGTQIFKVETQYAGTLYLRGWIATDYRNGRWYTADEATRELYADTFGNFTTPAESMRYDFFSLMIPGEWQDLEDVQKYHRSARYGLVSMQVNLHRIHSPGTLAYLPSYIAPEAKLRQVYTALPHEEITYANYFDGMYTGRSFKDGAAYAVLAGVPNMRETDFYENLAARIAEYNAARYYILNYEKRGINDFKRMIDRVTDFTVYDGDAITYSATTNKGEVYVIVDKETGAILTESEKNASAILAFTSELFTKYLREMSWYEKNEAKHALESATTYAEFVHNTYTGKGDSTLLASLAEEIRSGATRNTESGTLSAMLGIKGALLGGEERDSTLASTYETRHELVISVIDYITCLCEYTLEPSKPTDPTLDPIENFLFVTNEGYCVQFASAAALLLRELGIPVRYVDGYAAGEYTSYPLYMEKESRYYSYVHDYDAHAWIEVFYDGIGWIPYETTPRYYSTVYGVYEGESLDPGTFLPPSLTEEEEEPEDTLTPEELEELRRREEERQAREALMRRLFLGGAIVLALAALSALLAYHVVRAARAERERQCLAREALAGHIPPERRREDTYRLIDATNALLATLGLAREKDETWQAYAERVAESCEEELAPARDEDPENTIVGAHAPDRIAVETAFEAILEAEFAPELSEQALPCVARFYQAVRALAEKRLSAPKRFVAHFLRKRM